MGFLDALKRLFFKEDEPQVPAASPKPKPVEEQWTPEKVNQTAVNPAPANADTVGQPIADKASELLQSAREKAEQVGKELSENPVVQKAGQVAEQVGGKVLDGADKAWEKTKDMATSVGETIIETAAPVTEKLGEVATGIGEKVQEVAGEAMGRAKESLQNLGDKAKSFFDEAQEAAAEEAAAKAKEPKTTGYGEMVEKAEKAAREAAARGEDPPIGYEKLNESLLDGKDDFWKKASEWADGNYTGGKPEVKKPAPDSTPAKKDGESGIEDAHVVEE